MRGAVQEEQQRDGDADEQPRESVEDQNTEHRRHRGDEVGLRRDPVDRSESTCREAIEPDERAHVDQVEERGDDQRTERRLGEVFEQTGEEQQRHDRHDGCPRFAHLTRTLADISDSVQGGVISISRC